MKTRTVINSKKLLPMAALFGALLSGACTEARPIAASPNPGVGQALIDPARAGGIFAHTCVKKLPNFADALESLAGEPFTQSRATSTYFHQQANLSLKVHGRECSMVFAARDGDERVVRKLASGFEKALGRPAPRNITLTSSVAVDGLRYYRMGIEG